MVGLALLYSRGQGVSKDPKQAFDLDSKAAALGSADAEYQLGLAYDQGQGIKKDKNQAIDWYRKSAQQGNAGAQFNLGAIDGNHAEAYFWLSVAIDRLDGDALAKATALRDAAAAKLKPAEKADQDDKASKWHPTPETHP
jgi:TPR repeat protein